MSIFVYEKGCTAEGGAAVAASTNLVEVWRQLQADMQRYVSEHRADDKRYWKDCFPRLKRKLYWEIGYDYFTIKRFD